jgi:hypothetical protein
VAQLAGAEEFIDRLPRGYDTHIYEGSAKVPSQQMTMANQPSRTTRRVAALIRKAFIQFPLISDWCRGMTLTADVRFGTRSVAMYLLGAVIRGYNEAMREP